MSSTASASVYCTMITTTTTQCRVLDTAPHFVRLFVSAVRRGLHGCSLPGSARTGYWHNILVGTVLSRLNGGRFRFQSAADDSQHAVRGDNGARGAAERVPRAPQTLAAAGSAGADGTAAPRATGA